MKRRSAVLSLLISPPKLKMMALLSCRIHGAEDLHQEIQAEKVQAGWAGARFHVQCCCSRRLVRHCRRPKHPPYSPDLAAADFFLLPHVNKALAGLPLTSQSQENHMGWVTEIMDKEAYAAAFWKLYECWFKCIKLEGNCGEKNYKIFIPQKCIRFFLFSLSGFQPNASRVEPGYIYTILYTVFRYFAPKNRKQIFYAEKWIDFLVFLFFANTVV